MSTCDVTVGIDAEMEETALNRAEAVPGGDEASETLIRLDALATSPYRHDLHVGNIKAAATLQEREEARLFMNAVVSMSAELWMQWINERKQAVKLHPSVEACIDILDLHKRSCLDGLCKKFYRIMLVLMSLLLGPCTPQQFNCITSMRFMSFPSFMSVGDIPSRMPCRKMGCRCKP